MSSGSRPPPLPGRWTTWWIAGGVFVVLLALFGGLYAALGALSGPIKSLYGYVSGYPSFPNCRTTITREAKLGPVWYRVVDVKCPGDTMHFVYVKRGTGPGIFAIPAFFSAGSPVPVSVRQTPDGDFEILLSEPLADGRSALPLKSEEIAVPTARIFDHGRETSSQLMKY